MTQAEHRAIRAAYYRVSDRCTCQASNLPPDKDGRCLICRRPKS